MPLIVSWRRLKNGRETALITGTVEYPDGAKRRYRRRAQSDNPKLAEEERATTEARLLRDAWHGERRGVRSFAEGALSYLKAAPRSIGDQKRIERIVAIIGRDPMGSVDQTTIDRIRDRLYPEGCSPGTLRRGIITPVRAVLLHSWRRKWCDRPVFEVPKQPKGRTAYLLPQEAERLISSSAPHLKPLLVVLLCTGARLAAALELDWHEVDLKGSRVTFLPSKGRDEPRIVEQLFPRAIAALGSLSHRQGLVFRWETKARASGKSKRSQAYADRRHEGGGQIATAFAGACRRAGLSGITPHTLRHTWATWHYALHKDPLKLQIDGQWSSLDLVKRYTHLMPEGHAEAIRAFYGLGRISGAGEPTERARA